MLKQDQLLPPLPDLPQLSEIRIRRKELGLTQRELAKRCGVTQSFINKIERSEANPSYQTTRRIFEKLNEACKRTLKEIKTAGDIAVTDILSISTSDTLERARDLMVKNDFSQLPVTGRKVIAGSISDKRIISLDYQLRRGERVGEVMEARFPVFARDSKLEVICRALYDSPAVLVYWEPDRHALSKENIYGIITKHDILKVERF